MITRNAGRVSSVAAAMFAAAILVAGATAPAYAADPTTEAPKPAATAKPGKAKLYCMTGAMTGTRMAKKVCRTRADWIARDGFDPLADAAK